MHFFIDIKDEVVRSKVKRVNNDNRQIRKCGKSAAKFVNMLKMVVNLNKAVEIWRELCGEYYYIIQDVLKIIRAA